MPTASSGYAEMYEWVDGNPNHEHRAGISVVLHGDKIRSATILDSETIIGVIVADNTCVSVISNGALYEWHGKHEQNSLGQALPKPQTIVEWLEPGFRHYYDIDCVPEDIVIPADAVYHTVDPHTGQPFIKSIIAKEFNEDAEPYLPRWHRKEWGIVILLGRAIVREGSAVRPSWIKLKDLPGEFGGKALEEWLIR